MDKDFDVIVLGTGNAGFAAVGAAHAAGKKTLIVESREVGGTCPLRGCVPKKVLVAAAESLDAIERASVHKISVGKPKLDWAALIDRKQTFVDGVPEDFQKSLSGRGIDLVEGAARFEGPNQISVDGANYQAKNIVIATGSRPRHLPIQGFELAITSDDLLDLRNQPKSIIFIGAGVIAFEFSHLLARAGTKVTIVEIAPRPLAHLDVDVVAKLVEATEALGVEILTGAETQSITKGDGKRIVQVRRDGADLTIEAEVVANGAGRIANVDALNLDAADVRHNDSVIEIDKFLRSTSNPNVFAAGDAIIGPQLSPVASYEGRIVGHNLVNATMRSADYRTIPSAVFAVPALASVGLTEAAAKDMGLDFDARVNDMTSWRSAMTHAETHAFAKVLVEKGSEKILGAHILGHGAAEIIHLFSWAMKAGMTSADIKEQIYVYPTFANDIKFLV